MTMLTRKVGDREHNKLGLAWRLALTGSNVRLRSQGPT